MEWKISYVMGRTACNRETAVAYLEAEEWNVEEAIISLNGDKRQSSK